MNPLTPAAPIFSDAASLPLTVRTYLCDAFDHLSDWPQLWPQSPPLHARVEGHLIEVESPDVRIYYQTGDPTSVESCARVALRSLERSSELGERPPIVLMEDMTKLRNTGAIQLDVGPGDFYPLDLSLGLMVDATHGGPMRAPGWAIRTITETCQELKINLKSNLRGPAARALYAATHDRPVHEDDAAAFARHAITAIANNIYHDRSHWGEGHKYFDLLVALGQPDAVSAARSRNRGDGRATIISGRGQQIGRAGDGRLAFLRALGRLGCAQIRKLREANPGTPIVVITRARAGAALHHHCGPGPLSERLRPKTETRPARLGRFHGGL